MHIRMKQDFPGRNATTFVCIFVCLYNLFLQIISLFSITVASCFLSLSLSSHTQEFSKTTKLHFEEHFLYGGGDQEQEFQIVKSEATNLTAGISLYRHFSCIYELDYGQSQYVYLPIC